MSTSPEAQNFCSFDGGVTACASYLRPDRYRMIETDLGGQQRIARGGGYSYAAASFGSASLVLEMTRFNRVLRFDPVSRLIEVEAGIRLEEVLAVTAPLALWLPVQPGYPAITIGGCIAANVHGKNPWREGTFRRCVVDLTIFHPHTGILRVIPEQGADLFELTCGGYGLTGLILAATLRLEPLPGWTACVERIPVNSFAEGLAQIRLHTAASAFAYTWHDGTPSARTLGRGYTYLGTIPPGPPPAGRLVPPYRRLSAETRGCLRIPLWNAATIRLLGSGFRAFESLKPKRLQIPLFEAMFPFASRGEYFLLYGRRGLAEYQTLVPEDKIEEYLSRLEYEVLRLRPPVVMASMKLFRGKQSWLRFEGDGVCVTLNLVRSAKGLAFLDVLDRLTLDTAGLPHIIKDSRLPASVVAESYADYERFREQRLVYDPERLFGSELSLRLGL